METRASESRPSFGKQALIDFKQINTFKTKADIEVIKAELIPQFMQFNSEDSLDFCFKVLENILEDLCHQKINSLGSIYLTLEMLSEWRIKDDQTLIDMISNPVDKQWVELKLLAIRHFKRVLDIHRESPEPVGELLQEINRASARNDSTKRNNQYIDALKYLTDSSDESYPYERKGQRYRFQYIGEYALYHAYPRLQYSPTDTKQQESLLERQSILMDRALKYRGLTSILETPKAKYPLLSQQELDSWEQRKAQAITSLFQEIEREITKMLTCYPQHGCKYSSIGTPIEQYRSYLREIYKNCFHHELLGCQEVELLMFILELTFLLSSEKIALDEIERHASFLIDSNCNVNSRTLKACREFYFPVNIMIPINLRFLNHLMIHLNASTLLPSITAKLELLSRCGNQFQIKNFDSRESYFASDDMLDLLTTLAKASRNFLDQLEIQILILVFSHDNSPAPSVFLDKLLKNKLCDSLLQALNLDRKTIKNFSTLKTNTHKKLTDLYSMVETSNNSTPEKPYAFFSSILYYPDKVNIEDISISLYPKKLLRYSLDSHRNILHTIIKFIHRIGVIVPHAHDEDIAFHHSTMQSELYSRHTQLKFLEHTDAHILTTLSSPEKDIYNKLKNGLSNYGDLTRNITIEELRHLHSAVEKLRKYCSQMLDPSTKTVTALERDKWTTIQCSLPSDELMAEKLREVTRGQYDSGLKKWAAPVPQPEVMSEATPLLPLKSSGLRVNRQ